MSKTVTPAYTPEEGTLAARVVEFFRSNPEEQLTRADLAVKFSCAATSVDTALRRCIDAGLLATSNNDEMVRVWKAGPNVGQPGDPARKRRAPNVPHPPLDLSTVKIEMNVPKPEPKTGRGPIYGDLLAKMKPGSSVQLPLYNARRLMEWGRKTARRDKTGATYSLRKIDDNQARVWRDA